MPPERSLRHVHFVGIGGIGMSGMAQLLLERGERVSGSDLQMTPTLARLAARGARVFVGHQAAQVQGADLVVFSSSIAPQNPELVAARNQGIPTWSRATLLAEFLMGKTSVAVSGAHGKTTTTGLIASILLDAGRDPTILIGGDVARLGGNARWGQGRHVVVEADESDGSFVELAATIAVVTNIDEEHLDYYRNLREILEAYEQFVQRMAPGGTLVCCGDDPGVQQLLAGTRAPRLTYGLAGAWDLVAESPQVSGRHATYTARFKGQRLGDITLQIPGLHNVVNSLAAVATGLTLGCSFEEIRRALAQYEGAGRRFQARGDVDGIMVVEDYAHHPTEIAATLQAARTWPRGRLLCVFQPHRFSRTRYLRDRFSTCFAAADQVILTEVYAASEEPIEGIGAATLSAAIRASGFQAIEVLAREAVVPALLRTVRAGDTVLVLGAGDIGQVAGELVQALEARRAVAEARAC